MNNKKHILFFITSLQYGGAERVVTHLARYFKKLDKYKVTIMLLENKIDYELPRRDIRSLHRAQTNVIGKVFSLIVDPLRIKKFVKDNDVDIILSFMQRPNVINIFSKMLGSKHISCVNVRCSMKRHYEESPFFLKHPGRSILKRLWRYADKTIVNSDVIKKEVISLFNINPEKVELIYNPLDMEEIKIMSAEPVKEYPYGQKNIPIIINVSSLSRPKDHGFLLRAFSLLAAKRPAHLVIIGDGPLKRDLEAKAESLKIRDKVLFTGWHVNPYKFMARSDVFVLSSLYEGFPNVVLEALACGCPVVAVECVSGPTEILLPKEGADDIIIEAEYGILVKDRSEKILSKAIERVLDRGELSRRYTEAGRRRASQFDKVFIGNNYDAAISQLFS